METHLTPLQRFKWWTKPTGNAMYAQLIELHVTGEWDDWMLAKKFKVSIKEAQKIISFYYIGVPFEVRLISKV